LLKIAIKRAAMPPSENKPFNELRTRISAGSAGYAEGAIEVMIARKVGRNTRTAKYCHFAKGLIKRAKVRTGSANQTIVVR
jgi:hypothetical protein